MSPNDLRTSIESRLQKLHVSGAHLAPPAADAAFAGLHAEMTRFVEGAKVRLLGTSFDWTEEEKAQAGWIYATSHRIAALGLHLSDTLRRGGNDDAHTLAIVAITLLYLGEAMKWELAGGTKLARDYRGLHAIMRRELSTGRQSDPVQLDAGGAPRSCDVESLYFRALLLARFASGVLTAKQLEILDEWLWIWTPALKGVPEPPAGASALRADLDSVEGLRRGPRGEPGASLYLPPGPLDAAFRVLVAHFHEGRIVPERGCTAGFRIEEHMAVLDLIRSGLRASMRGPMARAPRQVMDRPVELLVGLAQITASGFTTVAPRAAALVLALKDRLPLAAARPVRESALDGVYEVERRTVNLTNVSESGFGLEGSQAACGMLAVGDLVAARLSASEPLAIGKVMRSVPAATPGRVIVGVSRISSAARLVDVTMSTARAPQAVSMLFVPGDDLSGSQDAYLVGERTFEDAPAIQVRAPEHVYTMRFNRVRDRGRGWVLAGFEILGARPAVTTPRPQPRAI